MKYALIIILLVHVISCQLKLGGLMSNRKSKIDVWNEHAKKRGDEVFFPFRYDVLRSPLFKLLSCRAKALLIEFVSQYNGYNNGDFSISFNQMKDKGWSSPTTLNEAKKELIETELVIITRQGGRNQCSLYGVSFLAIDNCNGKLDVKSTEKPPDNWKKHHYKLLNKSNSP